jgi:hypothetical protein
MTMMTILIEGEDGERDQQTRVEQTFSSAKNGGRQECLPHRSMNACPAGLWSACPTDPWNVRPT